MEASVLAPNKTPKVAKILRERFISVELYTDLPDKNPEEREHLDLLTHFNDGVHTAIPVYLIVTPDGETVLNRRFGRQSTDEFLRFLDLEKAKNSSSSTGGLLGLVIPSILLGLLTLIMPCTYPMIPITITIFTKGENPSWSRGLIRGLAYGAGIVVAYVGVGLAFDLLLGGDVAGQQKIQQLATDPWVNLCIGALFLYFAGSFFGFYDIWLPGIVQRSAAQGQSKVLGQVTLPGLFLLGSLFMVTSYSCGAPFVFQLFTTAAQESTRFSMTFALLIFSMTLALPFVLLALLPGLLKSIPGSGGWMTSFKVVLGFLEVAFALKFLSNTDLAAGDGWPFVLTRQVFLLLWIGITLLVIVYLLGKIRFPHDPEVTTIGGGRALWIGIFLFLACYLTGGLLGSPMGADLEAFLPPVKKHATTTVGSLPDEPSDLVFVQPPPDFDFSPSRRSKSSG